MRACPTGREGGLWALPDGLSEALPEGLSEALPEGLSEAVPEGLSEAVPGEGLSEALPGEGLSEALPGEGLSKALPGEGLSEALPGEGLGAVGADVGLLHAPLVRADVVGHAVLPLEALLADGAGVRLLVRVGEPVAVQVVHVSEGLPARLTRVVLPHLAGRRRHAARGTRGNLKRFDRQE